MTRPLVHLVHAFCAVLVLALVLPASAQQKAASWVGATREQVVEKLGEPKSNLKAGVREVLFFPRLKLTLRNGVVVETEEIPDESPPPPKKDATAQSAAPASAQPAAPSPQQAAAAAALVANAEVSNPQPATVAPVQTPVAAPPQAAPVREAPLEIKSVKSAPAGKSPTRPVASPPPPATTASSTLPAAGTQSKPASQATTVPPAPATSVAASTAPATTPTKSDSKGAAVTNRPAVMPDAEHPTVVEEISATEPAPAKPAVDPKKKATLRQRWRLRRDAETDGDDSVQLFSVQSYVLAAVIMIGGAGFLWWRWNQRKLALVATAVSHTPFEPALPTDTAGQFTADFIGRLSAKKFERLVASYYAKTGVVAERTNAGPESPVQIKIFWKGEPKPFAGVQCHSNPPILIGAKPLQDLFAALTTAEIRRGYVVTNGKFNVEARDYAEEKHFTLLPGDIFLEKLNALPSAARAELLKETATEEPAAPAPGPVIG